VIDSKGYRANVGIILSNADGRLFWGRRKGQEAWQFPQGGIQARESARAAMYRELAEETGLQPCHVEVMGCTRDWLRYELPARYIRRRSRPVCIGQKQRWFMLRLVGDESCVDLGASDRPEFDDWCWVDYWHPPTDVIFFKQAVYREALRELAPLLFPEYAPAAGSRG
jgi:putative (di)nucleoside polyphosphate hydrolase